MVYYKLIKVMIDIQSLAKVIINIVVDHYKNRFISELLVVY